MQTWKKVTLTIVLVLILVLVVAAAVFFRPQNLRTELGKVSDLYVERVENVIRGGEPKFENTVYEDLPKETADAISELIGKYSYHRNFNTLFHNGAKSLDRVMYLFTTKHPLDPGNPLEPEYLVNIRIDDCNHLAINETEYTLKNSAQLLKELDKILAGVKPSKVS